MMGLLEEFQVTAEGKPLCLTSVKVVTKAWLSSLISICAAK